MMQLPGRAVADSLPRFSWNKVFNWQQLANDLIEVAIIIAVSFLFYRFVGLPESRSAERKNQVKLGSKDPMVQLC